MPDPATATVTTSMSAAMSGFRINTALSSGDTFLRSANDRYERTEIGSLDPRDGLPDGRVAHRG